MEFRTGNLKEGDPSTLILQTLNGAALESLQHPADGIWQFAFADADLTLECPWRLINGETIVLGGSDHGHKFGLPEVVDVPAEVLRVLSRRTVEGVRVDEHTADLSIAFKGGARIEAFNASGGYEGWSFGSRSGLGIVAQGGGQIAMWVAGSVRDNNPEVRSWASRKLGFLAAA
jgi:hypothetical protein